MDEPGPSPVVARFTVSFIFTAAGDQGVPDKRPVRRNLSASLPPYGPVATTSAHQHSLQVTEEGMFPLQSTPLPQWARGAAAPPAAYDPNMTFEVADGEDQTADDSRSAAPAGVSTWQGSDPAEPHLSTAVGSVASTSRGCETLAFCLRCIFLFALVNLLNVFCKFAAN